MNVLNKNGESEELDTGKVETAVRDIAERELRENAAFQAEVDAIADWLFQNAARVNEYRATAEDQSRLFAAMFADRVSYNPTRKGFMTFAEQAEGGYVWTDDAEGLRAQNLLRAFVYALAAFNHRWYIAEQGRLLKEGRDIGNSDILNKIDARTKDFRKLQNPKARTLILNDSKGLMPIYERELDQNDFLLNCKNGVLDLSGSEPRLLQAAPEMKLSKLANVVYDPAAKCPRWEKFLDQVMEGNAEKVRYLQKLAGLALTGQTEEECFFILFGSTTRNGKSTFLETLAYMLGGYSVNVQPDTFAQRTGDGSAARGDIARLKGVRLACAAEPPRDMLLNASQIKQLTGRDTITARELYRAEFEFIPRFKLIFNTNYLPRILDLTVFKSDRVNVITFDRHFASREQDKTLKDRLRAAGELSGILNWCVDGLRLYREEELEPPLAVRVATKNYLSDSDRIAQFLTECMEHSERGGTSLKDAYTAYQRWCDEGGCRAENKQKFKADLESRGLIAPTATINGKTIKRVVKGYVLGEGWQDAPAPRLFGGR